MASFSAAGEEEDFNEDDFILGNEDVLDDEKPRLLGPVNKGPNSNKNRVSEVNDNTLIYIK